MLSANGSEVTLTGALCDDAKAGRFRNITFEFGCLTLPVW
jgi:hypothetical protein